MSTAFWVCIAFGFVAGLVGLFFLWQAHNIELSMKRNDHKDSFRDRKR